VAERRGKSMVDWEAAFAYYAALPPAERSYATVAAKFGVSVRTVETHGRSEHWKQRLRAIRDEVAARTADALADARVEEISKLRRLIDASLIAYAERLRAGMRMTPADLERLNRLSRALIDETTSPSPRPNPDPDQNELLQRTPEHTAAVLAALEETGALAALGLTRSQPADDAGPAEPADESDATRNAAERSADCEPRAGSPDREGAADDQPA